MLRELQKTTVTAKVNVNQFFAGGFLLWLNG